MSSINDNAGGELKNNVLPKKTALKMKGFPDRESNEISFSEDGESLGNIDSKKMIKQMEI